MYKNSRAGLQLETANFGSVVIRVNGSNRAQSEVNIFNQVGIELYKVATAFKLLTKVLLPVTATHDSLLFLNE